MVIASAFGFLYIMSYWHFKIWPKWKNLNLNLISRKKILLMLSSSLPEPVDPTYLKCILELLSLMSYLILFLGIYILDCVDHTLLCQWNIKYRSRWCHRRRCFLGSQKNQHGRSSSCQQFIMIMACKLFGHSSLRQPPRFKIYIIHLQGRRNRWHRKSEADKLIFWGKRANKLAIFEVASPEIILFLRPCK